MTDTDSALLGRFLVGGTDEKEWCAGAVMVVGLFDDGDVVPGDASAEDGVGFLEGFFGGPSGSKMSANGIYYSSIVARVAKRL